jgi:hypothetical protein
LVGKDVDSPMFMESLCPQRALIYADKCTEASIAIHYTYRENAFLTRTSKGK